MLSDEALVLAVGPLGIFVLGCRDRHHLAAARGIACLIVDGPGNGESIRFRDLYLRHDTEVYATPAYEWLAARPEIDPNRIGVMAIPATQLIYRLEKERR